MKTTSVAPPGGAAPLSQSIETFTEKEVAQLLRCSAAALRRMRKENRWPRWTKVGRLIRYPKSWLADFVQGNAGPPSTTNGNNDGTTGARGSADRAIDGKKETVTR